jgi:hypothetical protein
MTRRDSSVEPSSTTMTSRGEYVWFSALSTARARNRP